MERKKQQNLVLADIRKGLKKYPQVLVNIKVNPADSLDHPAIQAGLKDAEASLGKTGRILLRRSGTEPVVRVMVEGDDESRVTNTANALATLIKQIFTL